MKHPKQPGRYERTVHVVVDDRERYSGVVEVLSQMTAVSAEIRRLPLGDFLVANDLLVERKTVVDFAKSIFDGRLFRQAARLAACEHRTCFVLEGDVKTIDHWEMSRQAFQGAVITVSLVYDQPILRSRSPKETARLIVGAARQLTRRGARRPSRQVGFVPTPERIQSHMLQAIPGIGPEKADAILEHIGDIRAVSQTSIEKLLEVPGIGASMSQRIRHAFGRPI